MDSRMLQGSETVSFAYSLSQGHSQQAQIPPIHHGTRMMCGGTLFPLLNSHRAEERKQTGGRGMMYSRELTDIKNERRLMLVGLVGALAHGHVLHPVLFSAFTPALHQLGFLPSFNKVQ